MQFTVPTERSEAAQRAGSARTALMSGARADPSLRLMDKVRQPMRYHHYSFRTEKIYCDLIRIVQELMGHTDVKTTEIYTRVMEKSMSAVQSPLESLETS